MPTYEYACRDCGKSFEALRSMKDSDSPIACNSCQSMKTQRKLTTCNINCGSRKSSVSSSSSSGCGGCHGGSCASCGH